MGPANTAPPLEGTLWVLLLYDIAEQIHLDQLRGIVGAEPPSREPSFKRPAPDYVRFERPPVVVFPHDRASSVRGAI